MSSASIRLQANAKINTKSPNTLLTSSISNNGISIHPNQNFEMNNGIHQNNTHNCVDFLTMDDKDKRVIGEFLSLLEKSRLLFNGLRELPQYGHKTSQWQAYFGRTFDVYTKLWKFQQQHRQTLELKYNFKRWQIGEIASKIGQLYYHY